MSYPIDKNIPIPESNSHYSKFPFDKMEIGDSFFVSKEDLEVKSKEAVKQKVYSSYRKFLIETGILITLTFRTDRENNGVRIFRTK